MPFITDQKAKFDNLRVSLELTNRDQIRRTANGGNSVLFVYPPEEEHEYLKRARELLDDTNFSFIDISQLLVQFIDLDGWDGFQEYYKDFQNTPHKVFRSDDPAGDLFSIILRDIEVASEAGKIPVLIRTGALFGTGIENVNIMEHKMVMNLPQPLVIFYPASNDHESLLFLNFKHSSKYRCTVID